MANVVIRPGERWELEHLMAGIDPGNTVVLADEATEAIRRSSKWVDSLAVGPALLYGVNSGFGALANVRVRAGDEAELQRRHILSHACGIGLGAPVEVVRMMLLIKLLTFRSGYTGVSLEVAESLVRMLNNGIHPVVPERGTVGASGDLAPLSHLALPLLGLGQITVDGQVCDTRDVEEQLGLGRVELGPKDGLALTNGTQYISAVAVIELRRLLELARSADLIAAISTQAFSCADRFFHERYHRDSGNRWRAVVAKNLSRYAHGGNHAALDSAVPSMQDPYSFRCIPQVHGAVREHIAYAQNSILNEINTTADNPLFFVDDDLVLLGGNLHGESVAMAADMLGIAATELAAISERRTYQLLSGRRGLLDFLTEDPGVNSGLMISQYSAAALVSEAKTLAHPGSVDSIPTCQLQEDHVSMGGTSVLKLRQIVDNLENVLAIELMNACQAADLKAGLVLSPAVRGAQERYRTRVPRLKDDRVLAGDIEQTRQFLRHDLASDLVAEQTAAAGAREEAGR